MSQALKIAIVDDNENMRETLRDELEYAEIEAEPLAGPFPTLGDLVSTVTGRANAAVCDHHLIANYASCDGAEAVASLYKHRLPAVLVTTYGIANLHEIRLYRRQIPVLLTPDEANPDSLMRGWEVCRREFNGEYVPSRRPWQTMVQIEDVDGDTVYAILPSWNSNEVIKLPKEMINQNLHEHVNPGERFFAQVNKGAERQSELYFEEFEYRG